MSRPPSSSDAQAFLTAILWPEGCERDALSAAMATASGLDALTLKLKTRQHAPAIIGRFDRAAAQRAAKVITDFGGEALTPTADDLLALGPTLKVKDLRIEPAGIAADLWRGPTVHLRPDDIMSLVRAQLSEVKVDRMPQLPTEYIGRGMSRGLFTTAQNRYGAYGLAALYAVDYADDFTNAQAPRTITTSNKLDLHTFDGRVFQIDGDKFGFGILGDQRGHSDKVNVDRLCELFIHLAPHAVVDPYFPLWRPPTGFDRLRIPQRQVNNDDPAFAFYSRWVALIYRHLLKK